MPMSDIEIVVTRAKKLEHLFETKLQVSGRGLHEMGTAARKALGNDVLKRLRYVASVRNQIIHEFGKDRLDDRAGFIEACDVIEAAILAAVGETPRWGWKAWLLIGVVGVVVITAGVAFVS